ncbi:transposase [Acetobacter nitrogenifigens]|uniref:transposase n=1 Tax=Acetobacter nitrogenifigens TaxID=285268 RepID=UPI0011BF24A1
MAEADTLLDEVDPAAVIADKAYDADPFIGKLEDGHIASVIPSKKNRRNAREISRSLYKNKTSSSAIRQIEAVQRHCNTTRQAETNIPLSSRTRLCRHRNQLTIRPRVSVWICAEMQSNSSRSIDCKEERQDAIPVLSDFRGRYAHQNYSASH